MHDFQTMKIFQSFSNLLSDSSGCCLALGSLAHPLSQRSIFAKLSYYVNRFFGLDSLLVGRDAWVLNSLKNLNLAFQIGLTILR